MRSAALLVAFVTIVVGVAGFVSPDSLTTARRLYFATPVRLYAAGAVRAAMGLVIALIAAGALLQYFAKSETRRLFGQRANLGDLRPPQFRLVPLASADDFFKKAEGAKRRVDQARVKEPSGGLLSDFESSD